MTKIKNIRSSQVVDSAPKLPTAEQLDHGAIAINYAKGYETISIKNSEDEIVTLPFAQGTSESLWESGSGENSVQTIGTNANASGDCSVAEGAETDAHSYASHAEGYMTSTGTDANYSHTEGYKTSTQGVASHAEGDNTVTNNPAEHAEGRYNKSNMGGTEESNTLHSIGIGNGSGSIPGGERKNAVEVMENGDHYVIGVGGYDGKNFEDAATLQQVLNELTEHAFPYNFSVSSSNAQTYEKGSVVNGTATLSVTKKEQPVSGMTITPSEGTMSGYNWSLNGISTNKTINFALKDTSKTASITYSFADYRFFKATTEDLSDSTKAKNYLIANTTDDKLQNIGKDFTNSTDKSNISLNAGEYYIFAVCRDEDNTKEFKVITSAGATVEGLVQGSTKITRCGINKNYIYVAVPKGVQNWNFNITYVAKPKQ